jgi:homoaconitase/3-isopropylmalate dehydratase large subunit
MRFQVRNLEYGYGQFKSIALWCSAMALIVDHFLQELGGITGIFTPDEVTHSYVNARPRKTYKSSSLYFKADDEAQYAETFEIDLAKVESFVALYPSPDNVVPLAEKRGMTFDGCFIGACTTTEEELILAALVLQIGLRENLPLAPGKRKVVPGSLPIVNSLKKLGLLDVYRDAGFDRPAPGCSLCLGMAADRAEAGEIWLSSQNRNFQNRMGKGKSQTLVHGELNDSQQLLVSCRIDWQHLFCRHRCRIVLQHDPNRSSTTPGQGEP